MNILCIDPGLSTGIAHNNTIDNKPTTLTIKTHEEVYTLVISHTWDHVIVEQFSTENMISRYGLRTVELVGAIEALCWMKKLNFSRRTPVQRIPFLRRANILLKDQRYVTDHQKDALAHFLSWEYKCSRNL